jgi:hypothetical protein
VTGKFQVNGSHQVQLPDGGGPIALGASLVVIYRDPSLPQRAIVLYDGGYTMDQTSEGMVQRIAGFYDGGDSAKLTHIVGSGQANKSEILRFNGAAIATNPFRAVQGPNWDNPTYLLTPTAFPGLENLTQVTTSADHQGFSTFDCLTWAAIVYRTDVKDRDGDGLLDIWESSTTPIFDPNGQALPNLKAMGADPDHKDVFIELAYAPGMIRSCGRSPSYGGVPKPAHSHLPSHAALKLVGDARDCARCQSRWAPWDRSAHRRGPQLPGRRSRSASFAARAVRGGEAINELVTVCARGRRIRRECASSRPTRHGRLEDRLPVPQR